jgi:hypothetical protein
MNKGFIINTKITLYIKKSIKIFKLKDKKSKISESGWQKDTINFTCPLS